MDRSKYRAGAVKHGFWFMEFRKVISLRAEGMSWEEIKSLNENENIFGAPTSLRATQIFNTVSARVKSLDDSFYDVFAGCDLASQKLFALVAAMAYDALFENAAKWTEATIKKMMVSYKSMLYEAGVINKAKDVREIYKPLPDPAMERWMQDNGLTYELKAITGVR